MRKLIFDKDQWKKLKELCEAGYPKEVCGLLFGKIENGSQTERRVLKVELLSNILDGTHSARLKELVEMKAVPLDEQRAFSGGHTEFVIDPLEHYRKVSEAAREGLEQIGIFHSHPDHPSRPSVTDAAQPYLAGWSNVIAAVHKKKFLSAQSWHRQTEDSTFQEEEIVVK